MRIRRSIVTIGAALLVPALPALAGPQPGGERWLNGQGTNRGIGVGPSSPGIDWQVSFPEYDGGRSAGPAILDSEGHAVVAFVEAEPAGDEDWLVALDLTDGSVAWRLEGVSSDCTPVATDDGQIFAFREQTSGEAAILRIDATDGTVRETFESSDTVRFAPCIGGQVMRITPDGTLILSNWADFQQRVSAFATAGSIEFAWELLVPTNNWSERMVLAPDGSVGFVGWYDDDTNEIVVRAFDTADGSELDTHRMTLQSERARLWNLFAHDGDGLVFAYGEVPQTLFRLDTTASGTMTLDWSVDFSRDAAADESGTEERIGDDRYAFTGDSVVLRAGSDLHGISLADGSLDWSFRLEAGDNSTVGTVTDANGDVYAATFGGPALQSVTANGESRWVTEPPEDFWGVDKGVGAGDFLGPITPSGQLLVRHVDFDNAPTVTAVVNSATRLSGGASSTPINVAIQTCEFMFPEDDSAAGVLLARDDVFADALTGAPLAGDHSCILYTPGGPDAILDRATRAEIDRVLPGGAPVTILGGTNAVSQAVEDELRASGYAVTRLSGPSRFDTAIEIARVVRAQHPAETRTALAFSHNWPDAVTGGAWAAVEGVPVLLTQSDQLTSQTDAELDRLGTEQTIVFGGQAVISDAAANAAPNPTRYFGRNRYATATDIADRLWASVPNQGGAFVLTNLHHEHGWAFSLSAVPVSVRLVAPQLGVQSQLYPEDTSAYLRARGFDVAAGLVVLGDITVISDEVVDQVASDVGQ